MNASLTKTQKTEPPGEPRLKALLIEDNLLDARLIQIMLNEAGGGHFELERRDRLASGLEALEREGIDIVLLDLSLPDSAGGLGTFHQVHARVPHVPIIVMTGLDDENIAVHSVQQ